MLQKVRFQSKPPPPSALARVEKDIMLATPNSMEKVARMRRDKRTKTKRENPFAKILEEAKANLPRARSAASRFEIGSDERRSLFALLSFYRNILGGARTPIYQLNDVHINLETGEIKLIQIKDKILKIEDLLPD